MRRITTFIFTLFLLSTAMAQPSTMSTEHWVTFMENLTLMFNGPPSFQIVVSSEVDTQGEVVVPATGFSIPFTIEAMHDTVITLPANIYYPEGDEATFNFGLQVLADDPVSVYAYHNRVYFSEAAMTLPIERLGAAYTVLAHEDENGLNPSEFVVLATEDSTEVTIVPSVVTLGFRPPGVPFTILLNEGQVFQIQSYSDLSGTRVSSTDPLKPIAVFAGARQATVCNGGADDHLYQQLETRQAWGSAYYIVPFKQRGGDQVRILGSTDGTTVDITGQTSIVVDSGEVASIQVTQPVRINAIAPISVGQFNESQSCNPQNGDPCFLLCQPSERMDQRAIWSSLTGSGTPSHYANVVVPGGSIAPMLFLDNVDVTSQLVEMTGVPGVYWAQFSLTEGEHSIFCPTGFQGAGYGFGDYNSYSFSLGYGSSSSVQSIHEQTTTSTSLAAIVVQGGTLYAAQFGSTSWKSLHIADMEGRLVQTSGPGSIAQLNLAAGQYTIAMIDQDGRSLNARTMVIAP
jgi:hypothetical protein